MEPDELYIEKMKILTDQKIINQQYKKQGLTEELLQKQLDVNKRKHEYNITDLEEVIYTDTKGDVYTQ